MYLLNYFYFLILTVISFYYLINRDKVRIFKSPIRPRGYVLFNGTELFFYITFATGLFSLSAPGTLDLMAIRLLILELFCLMGLFISERKPIWTVVATFYIMYLIWLVIGLFYTSSFTYGIRTIMKYFYPPLIMLMASAAVRNQDVFLKVGLTTRLVALFTVITAFIPFLEWYVFPGTFWYGTARAIHFITIAMFSLALYYHTPYKRKNLIYTIVFILPCIIWVFRTSIAGTIAAIMIFYFFRYKIKSLPIITGIFILGVASVFFIPGIRDKMFKQGKEFDIEQFFEGEISTDDINTSYREFMWKWAMDNHFKGNEIVGTGTGNLQDVFYNHEDLGAGGRGIVHNDYIQILCDNGLIGIILYLLASISIIIHSFIIYNKGNSPTILKICAITAGASMGGVLVTLYGDNAVNYSMATLAYPWGFYGMMLGLNRKYQIKRNFAKNRI